MSYTWGGPGDQRVVQRRRHPPVGDHAAGNGDLGRTRRLAAELAPMVGVWERLIAQHTPNHAGRCRTCTQGSGGAAAAPWPCSIYDVADLARRRYDRDLRGA